MTACVEPWSQDDPQAISEAAVGVEVAVRTLGMQTSATRKKAHRRRLSRGSTMLPGAALDISPEQAEINDFSAAFEVFDVSGDGLVGISEMFDILGAMGSEGLRNNRPS